MHRRRFLQHAGSAAVLGLGNAAERSVAIVRDPADPVAAAAPVEWAVSELKAALAAGGVPVADSGAFRIRIARDASLAGPEALSLAPARDGITASASDARGLVYAVLELADRVQYAGDPLAALAIQSAVTERPANRIRSITRCFVSDVEDKPWYNDRAMWPAYLSMLAAQRFNRFSLAFGIGYDFLRQIRDCYFHFAYPFLLAAPGYHVRANPLPDSERDRNLEMLKFIGDETVARGLQFHLALWTHGYQWTDSPHANYTIEGLTPANHAAYSRDALYALLQACPAITGLTFRIHGESGVAEGSYDFWKTLFDGILKTGRRIEIDMHAKGMDRAMIEVALATGLPVTISPKYWAEHMGLPYHQAAIRDLEMPRRDRSSQGFFALSSGSRSFLRYGYGDLLDEDRRYGVLHRIWPGTQRLLLWGDPVMARAYSRASSFCGSSGIEICEPLSFKGRKGSGLPGGRCAYAERSLTPQWDWQKYLYTYRVWGRLLYHPDCAPYVWRRYLHTEFAQAAPAVETALANASRILPLVTTAHGASAANNSYWPEMYVNMPIVDAARKHPYGDTPSPKRFGFVSPFDPELFARIDDFAQELLGGERSCKYSPLEVAAHLDEFAGAAAKQLAQAAKITTPAFQRFAVDVAIQSGLGRFFAAKMRAGVLYAIHEHSGDRVALEEAIRAYRRARAAWTDLAERARGVYASDVTFGFDSHLRGHWLDRLPAIDQDIADMEKRLEQSRASESEHVRQAVREALAPPAVSPAAVSHTQPARFQPGAPLAIELACDTPQPLETRLHYRRVSQAEHWQVTDMRQDHNRQRAVIPADYTQSPFPLQYYFELRQGARAWMYPGLGPQLANQPYFVVRRG